MQGVIAAKRSATGCVILMALAVSGACGGHGQADDMPVPEETDVPSTLTVNNDNWLDCVIFAQHDGELSRIGTVTAVTSATFTLKPWILGQTRSIRLVAHPVGSEGVARTDLLKIQPGQVIEWRLENQLARSSVMVY